MKTDNSNLSFRASPPGWRRRGSVWEWTRFLFAFGLFFIGPSFSTNTVYGDFGNFGNCLWGGKNEETAYTSPYVRGMGGVDLAQATPPQMNLGAPPPAMTVQATTTSQGQTVSQATVPTITVPMGPVGTVGRPATDSTTNTTGNVQGQTNQIAQLPPGTELMYVIPSGLPQTEACVDGVPGTAAHAAKVVPAGTPGAIPVLVRPMTVRRPVKKYVWEFAPTSETVNTLVRVVDRRTGRVVKTYCRTDEVSEGCIPIPHQREVITYETVTVKVATPVQLSPGAAGGTNTNIGVSVSRQTSSIQQVSLPGGTFQRVNRPTEGLDDPNSGSFTTDVYSY